MDEKNDYIYIYTSTHPSRKMKLCHLQKMEPTGGHNTEQDQ